MSKVIPKTFAEAVVFDKSVNDFCRIAVEHCYQEWKTTYGDYTEDFFTDHLEHVYGVRANSVYVEYYSGHYDYCVVDERKYLLFRMKFSDSYNKEQGPMGPPGLNGPISTI